ncbi:MAG: helix-turn-helix domain-containing protein, partial [Acidobacteria bacterium]|nr:helix-turn-helix domain-containing protein [Acidobacteriota bacterium]
MAESFGARLRQQREQQQIALASIAEQTKISVSLLEGLERDDVMRWPTGIYRRSFVRSYAHAIGLDPEVVVREFLERYPDPTAIEPVSPATSATSDSDSQAPPTRLRSLLDRAIDAIPGHRVPRSVLNLGTAIEMSKAAPSDSTTAAPPPEPDLTAAAHLCTELARVMEPREVVPLLEGAAQVLGAVGLIVWVSDPHQTTLRPALAHGY